ncbi:MAG TPA: ABC transporter permease [Streptosporangiaceae bacterium]|nr:ABC transporter permease [Streptosporangiaceae bacterium]
MTTANSEHRHATSAAGTGSARRKAGSATEAKGRIRWRRPGPLDIGIGIGILAVVLVGAMTSRFFSLDNARAILASTAAVGITAIGATFVMIVGSAVSLAVSQTATVAAMIFLSTQQLGLGVAILLALACGVAVTAAQGAVIGFWTANPIVLTIAAGFAIGGVAIWISGGATVYPKATAFRTLDSTPLGLPLAVYVLIGLALLAQWMLHRTTAGRQLYLIGENPAAARAAGLPVGRVTVIAWAFFGACIALTGIFLASFNTSANADLGGTLSLDAIAAVLVGGTAIGGGRGSALRTLGGALLISVISDLLLLRGFSTGVQLLAKGLLVLLVVVTVHLRSTRGRR